MDQFILALDQGTTSSRAILFDKNGKIRSMSQKEFRQVFPKTGWVEHDPEEIWSSQLAVAKEAMSILGINGRSLAGIGITNQRETAIVWDRKTGEPVYNAIVWQDRRTAKFCSELNDKGYRGKIREKTGLLIDSYFSASKIKWILDNVPEVRKKAQNGKLAFGTVDSWLIWKLTRGKIHVTDVTNASRTLLYNINELKWDEELLQIFDIPPSMLPEVRSSSEIIDAADPVFFESEVSVAGIAGDQQAALFGQLCIEPGMAKNTYGTGCFILMNTGERAFIKEGNMLTTIAWQINGKTFYAMEGSIFNAGTAVQWLRDEMEFINHSSDIENLAMSVPDNGGVYMVSAFTGLGAPYWDPFARGIITGLTRGSNRGHIARAILEGIAFQSRDVLEEMKNITSVQLKELRVDGGASVNDLLMQFQADILNLKVVRPETTETTALGAAYLAGLATGFWDDITDLKEHWKIEKIFHPALDKKEIIHRCAQWKKAIERAVQWESH